jgi:transmembrane sensor
MLPANKRKKLLRLLKKYASGTATPEETRLVETYYAYFDKLAHIEDPLANAGDKADTEIRLLAKINARIEEAGQKHTRPLYRRLYVQTAAAAAVLLIATGIFLYRQRQSSATNTASQAVVRDFSPGRTGAVLEFEHSGRKVVLDTARDGHIVDGIIKTAGRLSINAGADPYEEHGRTANPVSVEYALLTTPKARIQELTLPDGSIVWLNAASSIRFPLQFTGKERLVEITGEVDFKVVHNDKIPFRVKARGMICEDIGTEFNINAYEDEPAVKTTLLEGAVRANGILLKPGQQAVVNNNSSVTTVIKNANTEQALAWKNGLFSFDEKSDLYAVMRQISRWYDVEIVYEGNIAPMQFGGKISRTANATEVLKILAYSNVHFRIEGKKIIVMP